VVFIGHIPTTQKLGQVFDKSAIPLCFFNKDASMLNFNKQFEKTFGYSRQEVKTLENWFQLAHPDSDYRKWVIDTCYSEIERAIETNSDIKPIEYNVSCKNGDVRTVVVFGSILDEVISIFDCDRAFLINFSGPDLESWTMPIARWRPQYPHFILK
jgi:PAS domain S-box-containing protein